MSGMRRRSWVWLAGSAVLLVAVLAPYVAAWRAQPSGFVFPGFLVNPIDGFSYLAKMRQGAAGNWTFRLPYAADPGPGAFLFLYYLLLGHITRILGAAPVAAYHAARILGAAAMLAAAVLFFRTTLAGHAARNWALGLVLFGSGLGWLGAGIGRLPIDLWVPEAIPFLSAYANAHFPLSSAAMLIAMTTLTAPVLKPGIRWAGAALAGVVLAVVQPFAVLPMVAVGLVWGLWMRLRPVPVAVPEGLQRQQGLAGVAFLAASVPWLIYDAWVVGRQPALAAWNAQNLTPTPPLADVVLGYGLVLVLAVAAIAVLKPVKDSGGRLLVVWLFVGLALVFAPIGLQRRMLLGLFFPMAGLAGVTLAALAAAGRWKKGLAYLLFVFCLPSNLFVMAATLGGALAREPELVMTSSEWAAYAWIDDHVPQGSLVLAGEVTGNRLPAYSDARVRYGHPFETPDAAGELAWVDSVYASDASAEDVLNELSQRSVDYIYVGPREAALGDLAWLAALAPVYQDQDVTIYGLDRP
jgi:hypothetical protein